MNRSSIVTAIACAFLSAAPLAAQVVVIVNQENPVASLTKNDTKAYFLTNSGAWKGGERVRPVDQPADSPDRIVFLQQVLGLTSAEVERHWVAKQYATGGAPPAKAADAATVIRMVRAAKGAIGFLSKKDFDAADKTGVKVVFTIAG
jgi:hypothetical protein